MPISPLSRPPVSSIMRLGSAFAKTFIMTLILAACAGPGQNLLGSTDKEFINNETKFSVSAFGVAASPRVTTSRQIRRGGGRAVVGQPYKIAGKWYYPKVETNYNKVGTASWYGPNFQGRLTANGETFDQYFLSAAHPTLPLPSYVQVKNLSNGRTVTVRVNDRGPFSNNRMIDLSRRAAEVLGFINQGTARVRVTYLGRAPVNGDDTNYLMASIGKNNTGGGGLPVPQPDYGRQNSSQPSIISRQNGGIFGAVISLFSYAEPGQGAKMISDAHQAAAAANSLANSSPELLAWASGVENGFANNNTQNPMPADQSTPVSIDLGTFADPQFAAEVARQFALFGAVDASYSRTGSNSPIRLVMTRLKAGVGEADVVQFIAELGLNAS